MLTRPQFRFSLLSLLLLTALVGVGVSHWLTTQRLRNAEEVSREQRQIIRRLNDDLKRLTVDDPSRVHVIATRASGNHWMSNTGFVPVHQMGWQVHLPGKPFPENPEWRLCWAIGDIPATGFPADSIDEGEIDTGLDSQIAISVEFADGRTRGWSARIAIGEKEKLHLMDDAHSDWLKEDEPMELACAGQRREGNARAVATESFAPHGPIVLLRQRRMSRTGNTWAVDPLPTQGVMIWLERTASPEK